MDDAYGVQLAAEHLISRGKESLVYVKDLDTASARAKAEGFAQAMKRAGKDPAGRILETDESMEGGIRAVEQLLESLLSGGDSYAPVTIQPEIVPDAST